MIDKVGEMHEKVEKLFPTNFDKNQMILTMLGTSGHLAEYFIGIDMRKLNPQTIYVLQMVAANMLTFMSDNPPDMIQKIDFSNAKLDEQGSQALFIRIIVLNENISEVIKYYENV